MVEHFSVTDPVLDFCDAKGVRLRQAIYGETISLDSSGLATRLRDGYKGMIRTQGLGPQSNPTHRISAQFGHLYETADIKSRVLKTLPFQSLLSASADKDHFLETAEGFLSISQSCPIETKHPNLCQTARRFLGVGYLWGGNSILGIDCSGLIAACCFEAGIDCPADSGEQAKALGQELSFDHGLQAQDFVFWPGHVGMMLDHKTLIHANGHHMTTVSENLDDVIARIKSQTGHDVSCYRRLG